MHSVAPRFSLYFPAAQFVQVWWENTEISGAITTSLKPHASSLTVPLSDVDTSSLNVDAVCSGMSTLISW
jgi:hypothetical protein